METVFGAARRLAVDAVAARVITSMEGQGVQPLLLKGAAVADWLYPEDDGSRWYEDIDLLVSEPELPVAERVLRRLGFKRFIPSDGVNREECGDMWLRDVDKMNVDLHRCCLVGANASADELWRVLAGNTRSITLQGTSVTTLSFAGTTLHVVLHAAQHGMEEPKPLRDLDRAVERVDWSTWRAAAELAGRIQAMEAFGAGLRLSPRGARLADRLDLPTPRSTATLLRAGSAPHLALGIERFATSPGLRSKVTLVVRKLVPEPSFMRAWSPLARHGRLGLAAAYAWRPIYLAKGIPQALYAWRRARRASKAGSYESAQ